MGGESDMLEKLKNWDFNCLGLMLKSETLQFYFVFVCLQGIKKERLIELNKDVTILTWRIFFVTGG